MRHLVLVVLAALLATSAPAQAPVGRTKLVGLTLDHWSGATGVGHALLRPTLRLTTYPARGLGADFALVFFPDGFSPFPPLLTLAPQAGLALPVRAGPVSVLLKGGAAGIVGAGLLPDGRYLHIIPGAQAGLGLFVPVDAKSSIRLDLTRHVYRSAGHSYGIWSVGFGVTGGRRR